METGKACQYGFVWFFLSVLGNSFRSDLHTMDSTLFAYIVHTETLHFSGRAQALR